MKTSVITRIEVFRLDIPSRPYRIALGLISSAQNLLVRVHADDGLYGVGEGAPIPYIAGETQGTCLEAAKALAHLLIGKSPLAVQARMRELGAFLAHNSTVRSAFDMALVDLLGKRAGLPLYALLGGEKRTISTDMTIGIDAPEAMADEARRIAAAGFPAVKLKLGTTRAEDVARVRAVREAVGTCIPLRLDANQGWSVPSAIATLRDVASLGVDYCEQPVPRWDIAGLKRVREMSPIPITADESLFDHHDAFHLAAAGACDYLNIKLAKAGGIGVALQIDAVAEAAGLHCMAGSMSETRLGLSAVAHVVSARPNIVFANLDTAFFHNVDPIMGGITYQGGEITLPDAPGHGADVDPAFLKRLECFTAS